MEKQHETLGARLGNNVRAGLALQGKAYSAYGAMLDQYARREIKATDFGRRALDLYVSAVGDVVSVAADMAVDVVQAGLGELSDARAEANRAVDELIREEEPERPTKRSGSKMSVAID
jgi:hypothetical protein